MPHEPGELDGQAVAPATLLWRAIDKLQRGQRPDKVSTVAFKATHRTALGNCLSMCARGEDWTHDHRIEWIEPTSPGHGIAQVTARQVLEAGFVRVIWQEREANGALVPGHVQAFYPEGKAAREAAIEALRDRATIVRDPEGWRLIPAEPVPPA